MLYILCFDVSFNENKFYTTWINILKIQIL